VRFGEEVLMSTNLKVLRQAAKLTQAEVAARLQVDQSAVSRWEAGAMPLRKYREKLSTLYHIHESDLFCDGKAERNDATPE
jgi:transcriptional regulator with XRE-family HTH domain